MLQYFLEFVGVWVVLYTIYRIGDFVAFHASSPSRPLAKYRRPGPKPTYALITGANGGIGYGIALALVQNGFGVILSGRNAAKLDTAAGQLREAVVVKGTDGLLECDKAEYVKTMVLNPLTASAADIGQSIRETLVEKGLKATILVNNVGGTVASPAYAELASYSSENIDQTIDLNARFMAHLTNQMLPILGDDGREATYDSRAEQISRSRPRSLILNLSSGAKIGVPYQTMYAATKSFNSVFSVSLSLELENNPHYNHVDCLSLLVGDVISQSNFAGYANHAPTSETYGRCVVEKTDGAVRRGMREMSPFWKHDLGFTLSDMLPSRRVEKRKTAIMQRKMGIVNELKG